MLTSHENCACMHGFITFGMIAANCEALPTFIPSAVGGDGDSTTPFWYVGYWPDRNAVIVAHQSTDVDDLFVIL